MSATVTASGLLAAVSPISRRVRAYFAPVNRVTGQPTIFDAAQSGRFAPDTPPSPWVDLGWCTGFARKSGSIVAPLRTGAPAVVQNQVRTEMESTVHLEFQSWGKLQLALASGSQQMNLLTTGAGAGANGSGGPSESAVALVTDGGASTATALDVGVAAGTSFSVGDLVAVDVDYSGQTGFVGAGISAAWVRAAADVAADVNYIRRVTLNVSRVVSIAGGVLQLGSALPAGTPVSGMQGEPGCGICGSRGRCFFSGVVGSVLPGWRAGGPGAVSLSAVAGDAVFGGDCRGAGGAAGAMEAGERRFERCLRRMRMTGRQCFVTGAICRGRCAPCRARQNLT